MLIECNRPGGFSFFGLRLAPGENIVDDEAWAAIKPRLAPKYLDALLAPRGDKPPQLVIYDAEPDAPRCLARDKIALIERCADIDDLALFEMGETRKTVLAAIERRMATLAEAETGS